MESAQLMDVLDTVEAHMLSLVHEQMSTIVDLRRTSKTHSWVRDRTLDRFQHNTQLCA